LNIYLYIYFYIYLYIYLFIYLFFYSFIFMAPLTHPSTRHPHPCSSFACFHFVPYFLFPPFAFFFLPGPTPHRPTLPTWRVIFLNNWHWRASNPTPDAVFSKSGPRWLRPFILRYEIFGNNEGEISVASARAKFRRALCCLNVCLCVPCYDFCFFFCF
jgi:hypothetical protein